MPSLLDDLERFRSESREDLHRADSLAALESIHLKFLGRKDGLLTVLLRALPSLPPEEKKTLGRQANEFKLDLQEALAGKKRSLEESALAQSLRRDAADLTLPGVPFQRGKPHPLTQVLEEITDYFVRLGFSVAEGPEVETDFNNFTALNHPPDHPARDAHDTFYLKDLKDESGKPLLLRTHTSPVQIRRMKSQKPPVRVVAPGRVFRHENVDATHSFVFHQVEGLAVDRGVSMADLKGALAGFARHIFGSRADIRFRPSYFPFVEPGIEVDVTCTLCGAKGCRVCKGTGWVEMLGAGMVHPNVFRAVGYDPEEVSGYAFGIGVERVAMFKFGVDDMRLFYENDIRFLRQF
jgi:phenylalanyl-tRNA synthetase alpha chain